MTSRLMAGEATRAYYSANPSARWTALTVICFGCFLGSLSLMAVNVAIPKIAIDLAASALHTSLLPTAFVAANAITMLPVGRLADSLGRKKVYTWGVGSLLFTSLLAAWAPTIEFLIFCRVLQGISTSMVYGCSMGIVADIFDDNRKRGLALGFVASSVYLGMSFGPLLGGWVTDAFGWRLVLAIPVPFLALTLLFLATKIQGEWRAAKASRLDWVGSGYFAASILLMITGISVAPSVPSVLLCFAAITTGYLFLHQQKMVANPLIQIDLVRQNRVFTRSILSVTVMYAALYPTLFMLSLYLQTIQGLTPTETGLTLTIQAVLMAVIAPISGKLSSVIQPGKLGAIGCVCAATGYLMLMWLDMQPRPALVSVSLAFIGIGFGCFTTPNNNSAMGSISTADKLGMASAILGLSRTIGNIFGTAIVVLLMIVFLKGQTIEAANYPQLLSAVHYLMLASLIFSLLGAYLSAKAVLFEKI